MTDDEYTVSKHTEQEIETFIQHAERLLFQIEDLSHGIRAVEGLMKQVVHGDALSQQAEDACDNEFIQRRMAFVLDSAFYAIVSKSFSGDHWPAWYSFRKELVDGMKDVLGQIVAVQAHRWFVVLTMGSTLNGNSP